MPPPTIDPPTAGTGGIDPAGMPQAGGGMSLAALPPPPPTKLYDVKIKRCIKSGQIKVAAIAPEDFFCDPNATKVDEDEGIFYADAALMTRSKAKLRWPKKKDLY